MVRSSTRARWVLRVVVQPCLALFAHVAVVQRPALEPQQWFDNPFEMERSVVPEGVRSNQGDRHRQWPLNKTGRTTKNFPDQDQVPPHWCVDEQRRMAFAIG